MEVGRTETLRDTLNPVWQKKIVIDYNFEKRQFLKLCVFDSDSSSADLDSHDFLGSCECTFGEVVAAQSKGFSKNLAKVKTGVIKVHAEELTSNKEVLFMKLTGVKLDKKDWFGKSDPFIEISRSTENNSYILVHRTEVIKNTLDPKWATIELSSRSLCNGDEFRDLKFDVYDWNRNGSHEIIGSFHTNVHNLKQGPSEVNKYNVIHQEKKKKKGNKYENSGLVILQNISVETFPSFLDFIQGGTQVNFTVAIDFTGSNGNPSDPRSLHYRDPSGRPNQYQTAIQAVGEIIQDYDSDKMFPALGFGARIPPDGKTSHEFFLNLTGDPYCTGVDGILAAYYQSLHNVQLYGPTNFSYVIRHVARFARAYQTDPSNYFVLLIITDGIITDFEETKRSIIEASHLPMSIIIVGVGDEDFSAMEELDSDDSLLRLNGKTAKRDIVQFVEMQNYVSNAGTHHARWNKELLAREVLFEIPEQLVGYMKSKKFMPLENRTGANPGPSGAPPLHRTPPPAYSPYLKHAFSTIFYNNRYK